MLRLVDIQKGRYGTIDTGRSSRTRLLSSKARSSSKQQISLLKDNSDAKLPILVDGLKSPPSRARNNNSRLSRNSSTRELTKSPSLNNVRMRQEARQRDMNNYMMAKKLMNVKGSNSINRVHLYNNYERHLRAKAVLCKLPIVNMSNNIFRRDMDELQRLTGKWITSSVTPAQASQFNRDRSSHLGLLMNSVTER